MSSQYPVAADIAAALEPAQRVLIMQAENPDGDSLATSLALEAIIGDLGKAPVLFSQVAMPRHLHHMAGWDRVQNELPGDFDLSILVDAASDTLLEKTFLQPASKRLSERPMIVIDHHDAIGSLRFEAISLIDPKAVATGEVVYVLAQLLKWPLSDAARRYIATSIMSDSLGLVSRKTTARTMRIMAELVEQGVSLAELDEQRRALMRRSAEITKYKGELLQRIEYHGPSNEIATITIPWEEIEKFSDQYNPPMLIIDDMRLTEGVRLVIAFKLYPDGKITGKIRTNPEGEVADKLAAAFEGGGHTYAAGFKVRDRDPKELKTAVIKEALRLLTLSTKQ